MRKWSKYLFLFIVSLLFILFSCSRVNEEEIRTGYCRYMPLSEGNWWTYHFTHEGGSFPEDSYVTFRVVNHLDNYEGYETWEIGGNDEQNDFAYAGSYGMKHKENFEVICGQDMLIGESVAFGFFSSREMTLAELIVDPVWGDTQVFHGERYGTIQTQSGTVYYTESWTEKYASGVGSYQYNYDYSDSDGDNEQMEWILVDYLVE